MKQIEWSRSYAAWGHSMASLERSYSPSRLLDVFRQYLPADPGAPVLELGSAPGRWLGWIEGRLRLRGVGIDMDDAGVRLSRELFPSVPILRGDASRLPFADASFAASFSLGLVEHFDDPSPILRESHRVIRPGGIVICSVPNLAPGTFRDWHWRAFKPENFTTHHAFTLQELGELVSSTGFEVIHREYNGIYLPHVQRTLGALPGRRLLVGLESPRVATSLVVVGRRAPG